MPVTFQVAHNSQNTQWHSEIHWQKTPNAQLFSFQSPFVTPQVKLRRIYSHISNIHSGLKIFEIFVSYMTEFPDILTVTLWPNFKIFSWFQNKTKNFFYSGVIIKTPWKIWRFSMLFYTIKKYINSLFP